MIDTTSPLIIGLIILFVTLIFGAIFYFVFKKLINKFLLLAIILVLLGVFWRYLRPWNYLFYFAGLVFLVLFIIGLFKKKKK
jgi:hypothetical protein